MHDVGIDGQVEYVDEDGLATGRLILIQVKSGPSYFARQKDGSVMYRPSQKHLHYWERAPVPVILILHNPERGETIWVDARRQIRAGVATISVPAGNLFDANGVVEALGSEGPLPRGRWDPHVTIREMVENSSGEPAFSMDFLDLFIHGLLDWSTSVFFDMSLALDIAEGKLLLAGSNSGVALGGAEFEFLLSYIQFLLARDLARIDVDLFVYLWEELEVVGRFIAPLTLRGRELAHVIAHASEEFDEDGIVVIQDKAFTGIPDFETVRRIRVVEAYKATIAPQ